MGTMDTFGHHFQYFAQYLEDPQGFVRVCAQAPVARTQDKAFRRRGTPLADFSYQ